MNHYGNHRQHVEVHHVTVETAREVLIKVPVDVNVVDHVIINVLVDEVGHVTVDIGVDHVTGVGVNHVIDVEVDHVTEGVGTGHVIKDLVVGVSRRIRNEERVVSRHHRKIKLVPRGTLLRRHD